MSAEEGDEEFGRRRTVQSRSAAGAVSVEKLQERAIRF